ncbi:MAG: DUF5681 domain-containing protein [Pseudomonadota bacterium]
MCDADEVGYGRPPKAHRFKKVQSGNPRGQPKKYKSDVSALKAPMTMTIGGKTQEVGAFEGSFRKTAQSALEDRLPAIKRFFNHCDNAGLMADPRAPRHGVVRAEISLDMFRDREFTDAELEEIERLNADIREDNQTRARRPQTDEEVVVVKVSSERHYVPQLGRTMSVVELVQHKLRQRALIERHEPSLAYFEQLLTRTTVELSGQDLGGVLVVPAGMPEWLTPLPIENVETGEVVKPIRPGEPGFVSTVKPKQKRTRRR